MIDTNNVIVLVTAVVVLVNTYETRKVKKVVNGRAIAQDARISQLTNALVEAGVQVPEGRRSTDTPEVTPVTGNTPDPPPAK